jgi:hypothetical protein
MRVQITKLPLDKAAYGKQVDGSLSLKPGAFGGADYRKLDGRSYEGVKDTLSAVPRDKANLEAEGGETAFGPISGQSIPDHLKIVGKRHHEGGVPLNLPDDTFIFSDTASLKINDANVLAMFNKTPKKGGYTPAELAKPYNINKYKSILLDPDSGKLERDTATIMIKNFIMKLGALALVQESMKGFPQGIPAMSKPYMEVNGISEQDLMPELKEQADQLAQSMNQGVNPEMPQEQNPMLAEEMQQANPMQAMEADQAMMNQGAQQAPAAPQQMPSGAPVASPESMAQMQGGMPPPEMMQQPGMMAYGGIPYAAYGMQMGGYDFPYHPEQMAYGGMPKFGGPGDSQVTVNNIGSKQVSSLSSGSDWIPSTSSIGTKGQYKIVKGQAVTWHGGGGGGGDPVAIAKGVCKKIEASLDIDDMLVRVFPGHLDGQRPTDASGNPNPKWEEAKQKAINTIISDPAAGGIYKDCIEGVKGKSQIAEHIVNEPNDEPCYCKDKNGNTINNEDGTPKVAKKDENGNCITDDPSCGGETESLICRCTDPVTGEVKEFPIENEEQCVCQDGSQGQVADKPRWSVNAKLNVLTNALANTGVARTNVVLPPDAKTSGAYESFDAKLHAANSAANNMKNAIMYSQAGSTADKQKQMGDLLDKALNAGVGAVADVQARNVNTQNSVNARKGQMDMAVNEARTNILNQGLANQARDQNLSSALKTKRNFNTTRAVMEANDQMANVYNRNQVTPQFNTEYDYGMMYHTGVEKPLTGATGPTKEDIVREHMRNGMTYEKANYLALKELKGKFGGQLYANGGYVYVDSWNPFIM